MSVFLHIPPLFFRIFSLNSKGFVNILQTKKSNDLNTVVQDGMILP